MCPWQAGKAGLPSPSLPCLLAFLLGSEGGALCWGSGPALPALLGSLTQSLLLWVWVALTVIIGCVKGDICF